MDEPFDSPQNLVQHGTCHRQFTREQGVFTIHQQCSFLALHLIAANIDAETDVLEYPTLEAFERYVARAAEAGRPYDLVGISSTASYLRKARRMFQAAKRISPNSTTVLGGAGVLAIGDLVEPFSDLMCGGDGVRYMREVLGQDVRAPVNHPVVSSVHFPNEILGCKANPSSYSLAVSMGCNRRCEFCSTSAQFKGERIPVLGSGERVFSAMKDIEGGLKQAGASVPALNFVVFDENFLLDEVLAREFLALNRQQLTQGTPFLTFFFADAASVRRYAVEELLEMGVDALWIGMEATDRVRFNKTEGTDFPRLVKQLQDNGIKVFLSFIAGLEDQTLESIEGDIEYALEIGATGYQYAVACPMPGTPWYQRLQQSGELSIERPEVLNMSHYYIRHRELDSEVVFRKTDEFQRRDYERYGPLALRFMRLRLSGYKRHRHSRNGALAARARGFRNDLMDAVGILSVGAVFAPNDHVRQLFAETLREVKREVRPRDVVRDVAQGRASAASLIQLALFTSRLTEPIGRLGVTILALRKDPRSRQRCRTLLGLIKNAKECIEELRHGMAPWDQPKLVVSHYPKEPERKTNQPSGLLGRLLDRTGGVPLVGRVQA